MSKNENVPEWCKSCIECARKMQIMIGCVECVSIMHMDAFVSGTPKMCLKGVNHVLSVLNVRQS